LLSNSSFAEPPVEYTIFNVRLFGRLHMHPRNILGLRRPDFAALAQQYSYLTPHVTFDQYTKPHIDFADASALSALTRATLQHYFHLDVAPPEGFLVPAIPNRLNYLHWIEDLLISGGLRLEDLDHPEEPIRGIDIGQTEDLIAFRATLRRIRV
jgi:23S rRNA (adenine1618-N6)-methyltransferase